MEKMRAINVKPPVNPLLEQEDQAALQNRLLEQRPHGGGRKKKCHDELDQVLAFMAATFAQMPELRAGVASCDPQTAVAEKTGSASAMAPSQQRWDASGQGSDQHRRAVSQHDAAAPVAAIAGDMAAIPSNVDMLPAHKTPSLPQDQAPGTDKHDLSAQHLKFSQQENADGKEALRWPMQSHSTVSAPASALVLEEGATHPLRRTGERTALAAAASGASSSTANQWTYHFRTWGEQHAVTVASMPASADRGDPGAMPLTLHPSSVLVEQRLHAHAPSVAKEGFSFSDDADAQADDGGRRQHREREDDIS